MIFPDWFLFGIPIGVAVLVIINLAIPDKAKRMGQFPPKWCCQKCGEPIGYIGRFFMFFHLFHKHPKKEIK